VYLAKTIAFWRRQCGHQQTLEITLGFEFEQLVVQLVQIAEVAIDLQLDQLVVQLITSA
jgi:hypothetical protein